MNFSLGWGTGQVRSPSIDELSPKHSLLAQIGIHMCPVAYWKVPVWAVCWHKSQSVGTRKPSLTGWCLEPHEAPLPPVSLPGATWPGTFQNKEESHREVLGQVTGWGWTRCLQQTRGRGKKRPKKYMSLCISPRMAAYDCGVGANDIKFQPPAV